MKNADHIREVTKKPTLNKEQFYEKLKPYAKEKYQNILIFMFLDEHFRFQLVFDWDSSRFDGSFNPIATGQLMDMHQIGSKRYIVPDIHFNVIDEGINTDFKMYKFLKKWIDEAFKKYDHFAKDGKKV